MTQALLNNLVKQTNLSEKSTNSKGVVSMDSSNDFQKLFENKRLQKNDSDVERNKIGDEIRNKDEAENKSSINQTDEQTDNKVSIARDIRDLIAYIETTTEDGENVLKSEEVAEEIVDEIGSLISSSEETQEEPVEENTEEETENVQKEEDTTINITESKEIYTDPSVVMQLQNTTDTTNASVIQAENSILEDDTELNVTLNGKDITNFEDLTSLNDTAETTTSVKPENSVDTEMKTLEEIVDEDMLKELNVESAESELSGDSAGESDIMQQQTPEEQGVKAMLQGDVDFSVEMKQNLQSQTTQMSGKTTTTTDVTPNKIIEQITKQMEGLQNGSKVNIVLNPESLGKVSIQLINTKEGLSAQFTVATQEARNLIMKGLDGLKDTLMSHGVSVDNVTVKLNETQESKYNADWTEQDGSRGGNKDQNPHREQRDKDQFERMMSFVEDENGKLQKGGE